MDQKTITKEATGASSTKTVAESQTPPKGTWFNLLEEWKVGDHAGILGVLISFFGLWLTYREAKRSRTAAEAAQQAAEETRKVRQLVDVTLELASIRENLAELKKVVLSNDWNSVGARIDGLCHSLGNARLGMLDGAHAKFTEEDRDVLHGAAKKLREFEPKLTKKSAKPPTDGKSNAALHRQIITPLTEIIDAVDSVRYKAKSLSANR